MASSFACTECDKTYKSATARNRHAKYDHGEPKFPCTWEGCDRKFRQNSGLVEHMCTHTGIYPFNCATCGFQTVKKNKLDKHSCKSKMQRLTSKKETAALAAKKKAMGGKKAPRSDCSKCGAPHSAIRSATGLRPATHCNECGMAEGMRDVRVTCRTCGTATAYYGTYDHDLAGGLSCKSACKDHAKPGDVELPRKCSVSECTMPALYAPLGEFRGGVLRCVTHRKGSDAYRGLVTCANCKRIEPASELGSIYCRGCADETRRRCFKCMEIHHGEAKRCHEVAYSEKYCRAHAPDPTKEEYTTPKRKRCEEDGCDAHAIRGDVSKKRRWCVKHADAHGGVKVPSATVALEPSKRTHLYGFCRECGKCASFGISKTPEWCKDHAPEDAINVRIHRCACGKQATMKAAQTYEYDRTNRYTHCEECFRAEFSAAAAADAVSLSDMKTNKCVVCGIVASWGPPDGKPVHCRKHRDPGDVGLRNRICDRCGSRDHNAMHIPIEDQEKRICKECADAISVGGVRKSMTIGQPYCESCVSSKKVTIAKYGFFGTTPTHCQEHAVDGEVYDPKKMCQSCFKEYATFGVRMLDTCEKHANPDSAVFIEDCNLDVIQKLKRCCYGACDEHKLLWAGFPQSRDFCADCAKAQADKGLDIEEMVESRCTKCGMQWVLNRDGLCIDYCGKPLKDRIPFEKRKENAVAEMIERNGWDVIRDRIVDGGTSCSTKRPDFVFEICDDDGIPREYLVLEVDEHQHTGYPLECEITRMRELSQLLAAQAIQEDGKGAKVRWIRYNPDGYYNKDGGRVFHQDRRVKDLETHLERIFKKESPLCDVDAPISVLYLFYGRQPSHAHESHGWHNEIKSFDLL